MSEKINTRVAGLDVLRIALTLAIFVFHSRGHFSCDYGPMNHFADMGATAMTGFFMLSAYSLYLSSRDRNLMELDGMWRFYLKRFIAVFPLYYAVAVLYVLFIGKESVTDNLILLPIGLLGIQSTYSGLFTISHVGGTWFISCLLVCYLLFPFLQTIIGKMTDKARIILISACAFILLWSPFVVYRFQCGPIYSNPFFRLLEFTTGLALANLNNSESLAGCKTLNCLRAKPMPLIAGILMIAGISLAVSLNVAPGNFMLYNWIVLPCYGIMLLGLGHQRYRSIQDSQVLAFLGKISYAFFMAQFFVWDISNYALNYSGTDSNMLRITVSFITCSLLSLVFYYGIGKPAGRLLGKAWIK